MQPKTTSMEIPFFVSVSNHDDEICMSLIMACFPFSLIFPASWVAGQARTHTQAGEKTGKTYLAGLSGVERTEI
jgi:hypothetical protein